MSATIVNQTADSLTIQVVIKFNPSMLEAENAICDALNQAGTLATGNFLHRFDTDGSPIVVGQTKLLTWQIKIVPAVYWRISVGGADLD